MNYERHTHRDHNQRRLYQLDGQGQGDQGRRQGTFGRQGIGMHRFPNRLRRQLFGVEQAGCDGFAHCGVDLDRELDQKQHISKDGIARDSEGFRREFFKSIGDVLLISEGLR